MTEGRPAAGGRSSFLRRGKKAYGSATAAGSEGPWPDYFLGIQNNFIDFMLFSIFQGILLWSQSFAWISRRTNYWNSKKQRFNLPPPAYPPTKHGPPRGRPKSEHLVNSCWALPQVSGSFASHEMMRHCPMFQAVKFKISQDSATPKLPKFVGASSGKADWA